MNRIAGLLIAAVLAFFAMGPVGAHQLPVASLDPKSGPAGTEITINVSQHSSNITIEVREDTGSGTLIGTGSTDGSGTGAFPIIIPASAPTGSYLLYICGLCTSQYPEWSTRGFQVTGPAPTPTTVATTTTTTTAPPSTTATTTTTAPPSTTAATATTIPAAADTTLAAGGGSSSEGILIGLLIGAVAMALLLGGLMIRSQNASRDAPPPPRPPPGP